jgi:hypothetical protein
MDQTPDETRVQMERSWVRLCYCRVQIPKARKLVKSGKVKSDIVRSVGLMSKTQEADLSLTESHGRSRADLDLEYEVQEVRVQSEHSLERKQGVGKEVGVK